MLEFNPDPDILSSLYSLTWGVNYVTNISYVGNCAIYLDHEKIPDLQSSSV